MVHKYCNQDVLYIQNTNVYWLPKNLKKQTNMLWWCSTQLCMDSIQDYHAWYVHDNPAFNSIQESHAWYLHDNPNTGITGGQLSLDIGDLVSACATEVNLSQKVQALSKSEKYAYLRQHSRPDPHFPFPKTFIGGCKHSFIHVWLDQHKWLCYSTRLNGAFCMPCLLFNGMSDSTGRVSGVLVTKPFQTWQKKSEKFSNHEKTSYHQCSLQMAEELVHSVEHPERNLPALFSWQHHQEQRHFEVCG